jgi:hypothetical protein
MKINKEVVWQARLPEGSYRGRSSRSGRMIYRIEDGAREKP